MSVSVSNLSGGGAAFSRRVELHPRDKAIHPSLQEFPGVFISDAARVIQKPSRIWMNASGWPSVGTSR